MNPVELIDWGLIGYSTLWILGLSLALAALSFADYTARQTRASLRYVLRRTPYPGVFSASGLLFALGMMGLSQVAWERLGWGVVAAGLGYETWRAVRESGAPSFDLTAWLRELTQPQWRVSAVILALAGLRGALYAFTVPPWQHPDEPTHFEHIRLIADTGRLPTPRTVSLPLRQEISASMLRHGFWRGIQQPVLDDASLSTTPNSPLGITTTGHPRLYYLLAALWLRPWLRLSVEAQLYIVRLLSVLLNLGVVTVTWLTAAALFPARRDIVLGTLGLLLFQPMYTDIMAAANNDALVNLLASAFFWQVAGIYQRGTTGPAVGMALALLVAGLLTKTTALAIVASAPVALLFYPWPCRQARSIVIGVVGVTGLILVLGFLGMSQPAAAWWQPLTTALARYVRADLPGTWQNLASPEARVQYYQTAVIVFQSFWAIFGWRHILLSAPWYQALTLVTVVAFGGLVWRGALWVRQRGWQRADGWRGRYLLFGLSALIVAWLAAIFRSQIEQGTGRTYFSHGRYVFVAILPFALLFTTGWLAGAPPRWRRLALWLYVLALVVFDAAAFWGYLVPYYHR